MSIRASEAIAVVGLSCRLPGGVNSPNEYWQLLTEDKSAISPVPKDRENMIFGNGKENINPPAGLLVGGFIDDIRGFDADFFSISPREASEMDPQQRIMLELAWQALEDTNRRKDSKRRQEHSDANNEDTGVFIGSMWSSHYHMGLGTENINPHFVTGTDASLIANRISHQLKLTGPSVVVNTASSSSLVAVHQAVQSLQLGECDKALAGGINLFASPYSGLAMAKMGTLSPTGECRPFDIRANGYVRGEGGGLVVLKRLSDAIENDDPIYCVLAGSAVSNESCHGDLVRPNINAQVKLIKKAWKKSGMPLARAAYIETHGTGTPVGDPIELNALTEVFPNQDLVFGSVKSKIGHLEAAAGIAGLIKTILSLHHKRIPASSTDFQPSALLQKTPKLRLADEQNIWPEDSTLAGVSSFGLGGTNAHIVLGACELWPLARARGDIGRARSDIGKATNKRENETNLFLLSAKTPEALREQAKKHLDFRASNKINDEGAYTAATATERSAFQHRLSIIAKNAQDLDKRLNAFVEGKRATAYSQGSVHETEPKTAFLFSGQGSQYPGMGKSLYQQEAVFAQAIDRCAETLDKILAYPLKDILFDENNDLIHQTCYTQPALFAVEYALAKLWLSWGVKPTLLLGHSVGEYVAAVIAGVFSLEDGLRLIAERGALMQSLPKGGGMAALTIDKASLRELLKRFDQENEIQIAAENAENMLVISGCLEAINRFIALPELSKADAKLLKVSHAFHSALMDAILEQFEAFAKTIPFHSPKIPIVSNLNGEIVGEEICQAKYWRDHLRGTVAFYSCVKQLQQHDISALLEVGPHPTLTGMAARTLDVNKFAMLSSLKRGSDHRKILLSSLGEMFVKGLPIDWNAVYKDYASNFVELPTYAFDHKPYWHKHEPLITLVRENTSLDEKLGQEYQESKTTNTEQTAPRSYESPSDIKQLLCECVRDVLGLEEDSELDPLRGFKELGMDSMLSVQLAGNLEKQLGCVLTQTVAMDYPNINALLDHLCQCYWPEERKTQTNSSHTNNSSAEELNQAKDKIAIIGVACRFPGAETPEEYWQLLSEGRETIGEVPQERWSSEALYSDDPAAPGTIYSRRGGFIKNIEYFDAEHFGISPREAEKLDPQQRLLLSLSYEALEDAGLAGEHLKGSKTGVFVGLSTQDYATLIAQNSPIGGDAYSLTGTAPSVAAGRIAYHFDLRGPVMSVDTACSSSLAAVHNACQSLRLGESKLALAAGVNLMLVPDSTAAMARLQALSASAVCRPFDEAGDGMVRSEGGAVVVLKKLSDAERDGDPILSVINGSALIHDGASSGLTVPNGPAQERVIEEALLSAGVDPEQVDYVEAHGTGTRLGDPIEVQALGAAYGSEQRKNKLLVGSVKSNIGHLEAAAGMAGLIKLSLSLQHKEIPASINVENLNPLIAWQDLPVEVVRQSRPWPFNSKHPRGAVSSFGISGTNAHVVLEQYSSDKSLPKNDSPEVLLLAAASEKALLARAEQFLSLVEEPSISSAQLCQAAYAKRAQGLYKFAIVHKDKESCAQQLKLKIKDQLAPRVLANEYPKITFVFPGIGGQWLGMARDLMRSNACFRESMQACNDAILKWQDWSLIDEICQDDSRLSHNDNKMVQPAIFAVGVSLVAVYREWGVEADTVIGHSLGEITAAHVSGILELEEAMRILLHRCEALMPVTGKGTMIVVALPMREANALTEGFEDRIGVGVSNSHDMTVLSGDRLALNELIPTLDKKEIFWRWVNIDYASHSPAMDAILPDFIQRLGDVRRQQGNIQMLSTATLEKVSGEVLDAHYWAKNLRQPVRFSEAMDKLMEEGKRIFIEMGPNPLLLTPMQSLAKDANSTIASVGGLKRNTDGELCIMQSLAALHEAGVDIAWRRRYEKRGSHIALPSYPWQLKKHWISSSAQSIHKGNEALAWQQENPSISDAAHRVEFNTQISLSNAAYLADHCINEQAIVPGAMFLHWISVAGKQFTQSKGQSQKLLIENFSIKKALPISKESIDVRTQLSLALDRCEIALSCSSNADIWSDYAEADIASYSDSAREKNESYGELSILQDKINSREDTKAYYAALADAGLEYGDTFQCVKALWRYSNAMLAKVEVDEKLALHPDFLHPIVIDGAFQMAVALATKNEKVTLLPVACEQFQYFVKPELSVWVHVEMSEDDPLRAQHLAFYSDNGELVALAKGLQLKALEPKQNTETLQHYLTRWQKHEVEFEMSEHSHEYVVVHHQTSEAEDLIQQLRLVQPSVKSVGIPHDDILLKKAINHLLKQTKTSGIRFIYLAACQESSKLDERVNEAGQRDLYSLLCLVQTLLAAENQVELTIVTSQAQAVVKQDKTILPFHTALWGKAKVIQTEHPELHCKIFDVDREAWRDNNFARALLSQAPSLGAWRANNLWRPQLEAGPVTNNNNANLDTEGCFIVTGGLGALGSELARWLVNCGVDDLVLLGRSRPTKEAEKHIADLVALGTRVSVESVDVSDRRQLDKCLQKIRQSGRKIKGVFHTAGILEDALLPKLTVQSMEKVLAAKALGASYLDQLTQQDELRYFVLYGSVVNTFGLGGQANYAAANAYLEGLAQARHARGKPALCIHWGPFKDIGFAASSDLRGKRLEGRGFQGIDATQGTRYMQHLLASDLCHAAVMHFNASQWLSLSSSNDAQYFVEGLRSATETAQVKQIAASLMQVPVSRRLSMLEQEVAEIAAKVLRCEVSTLNTQTALRDLGLDSLMGLELRNQLIASSGVSLAPTVLWSYPSVGALAELILEKIQEQFSEQTAQAPPPGNIEKQAPSSSEVSESEALLALEKELAGLEEFL